jgi:hypothetical protein
MASTRLKSVKCKVANIVLLFFFKSNRNPDNKSPLVIPPKFLAMPSYEASSSSSKVTSNSKSKHAPNLFEIQVLANKKDNPLSKKSKKNYDVFDKCNTIWATQFPWAEILKSDFGEINCVKCIMCSIVKG